MLSPIQVKSLSYSYGSVLALDSVTADFPQQQVTAIVGGNGSGKSTLLEILAGTLQPSAGEVLNLPTNIAIVPQCSQVSDQLPMSVRQTVNMGRWQSRGLISRLTDQDRRVVDAAMDRLSILDLANRCLGELSGGQRQRVLIAQGLAQQAPLLLLDEPLAAVDSTANELINRAINEEKARGTTVILATHDDQQARDADQRIELKQGVVA